MKTKYVVAIHSFEYLFDEGHKPERVPSKQRRRHRALDPVAKVGAFFTRTGLPLLVLVTDPDYREPGDGGPVPLKPSA